MDKSNTRLLGFPLAVIAAVAFSVVMPFFGLGIPSGHDFEFHFNSWMEVLEHWKEGIVYPHWAALAHYGYGEVRFIFYPPLSWILGAALGAILPWKIVSGAYIWLILTLCGSSMFVLARRYFPRNDSLIATVIYAANPYHIVIVYWRSAMAELLAAAFLPLLLLLILRFDEDGWRVVPPLGLLLAGGWLTNVPTAVMMHYSLAVLVLGIALSRKSWRVLAQAAVSAILGGMLACIYLIPVLHQQTWVNINQVLAPGVRPVDNFLFTITSDPDHNRFNGLASMVALWEILIIAVLLARSRASRRQMLWRLMVVWAALSTVLMIRFTLPLWTHLPELRYVQLPWRWLLCLNVAFALAVMMAFRRWSLRIIIYLIALGSVVWVWHRVLPPWWDTRSDIQEMVDNQQDGVGNEGTDEYVPAGVDPYDIDQNAPPARFEGRGSARIRIDRWQTEGRLIVADTPSTGRLIVRLFNYPAWKVQVNGRPVQTETTPHTAQMVIPLAAGENSVQITFIEGWDRWLGAAISGIAFLITIAAFLRSRRQQPVVHG